VSIKPRLPVRALPRRASTLKSEDEVLKERLVTMWAICCSTHMVSLEFPHFDTIACKIWTELKGLLSLVEFESISSNIASAAGIWRRRLWTVMAVSTKVLLIGARPLAIRTFAYAVAMFAAVAWSRPWAPANVSRKI
jgi:hypothetical protein